MKLTFERDIPEFKNTSWQQRILLRKQASSLDKRIYFRGILVNITFAPLFSLLMVLRKLDYLPSLAWVVFLYFAVGIPMVFLLRAWWVNPLVKKSIQTSTA